ncbi:hypothetical protein [Azospirillum sp. TSO22-1]|uniref:hypothetical protein n=1 Tax=Azospirillum sp. TSO22-1 TaxID=716789 RepID=UPI000D642A9A|nr:hypothetical protein [Azospirillum sp. TSO22-1]
MAKTLVALFDALDDAEAAERDLLAAGFSDMEVEVLHNSGYGAGEGYGEVMPQLEGWGAPHDEAVAYAEGLRRGGALLVVSPRDDEAVNRAMGVLESGDSVDLAARSAEWRASGWTGEPPPVMVKPRTDTGGDGNLGKAAEALRVSNAEAVPPPPVNPGTASPSAVPGSAADAARQRLDHEDPERR